MQTPSSLLPYIAATSSLQNRSHTPSLPRTSCTDSHDLLVAPCHGDILPQVFVCGKCPVLLSVCHHPLFRCCAGLVTPACLLTRPRPAVASSIPHPTHHVFLPSPSRLRTGPSARQAPGATLDCETPEPARWIPLAHDVTCMQTQFVQV